MSQELTCPKCGKTFDGMTFDEDYCPLDGTLLVRADVPETPAERTVATVVEPDGDGGSPGLGASALAAPEVLAERSRSEETKSDGRLADFMSRLGLRRAADKETLGRDRPRPAQAPLEEPPSPLPAAALDQGWQISGPVQSSPGLDCWPVDRINESAATVSGHYNRYRTGALTPDALYRRLAGATTSRLAQIWAHGTVDLRGARADYELVSVSKPGRRLDHWFADGMPSEHRARHLLPKLVDMVGQLATTNVRPLTLEPSQLVMTDDGELWLATAGALADTSTTDDYRPELERSALLAQGWAAPELTQQNLVSANAVVFSIGQLLALALWGQPCSSADLQTGAVTFKSIGDASLARVLMGCLWPRSRERWTVDHLRQAVAAGEAEAMPATPPWESLVPGASSTSFSFAGASYWRLETLLSDAVAPAHWSEATTRLEAILEWAEGTAWIGQAKLLRAALTQGRSADWTLVALARAVRPEAPLTWRGLDLSDAEATQSLVSLAQRALRHGGADVATMRALFEADLRGACTPLPPHPCD